MMSDLAKDETGTDPDMYPSAPPAIANHPLFTGAKSVGIVTPDNPRLPVAFPGAAHEQMKKQIQGMGLEFQETNGHYDLPEHSYMVYGPSREQMHFLGKNFGQEAVVYSEGGRHELMYTNGQNDGKYHPSIPAVKFHPTQPFDNYWTHVPGHGYLGLQFDQNKLLPSPHLIQHPAAFVAKSEVAHLVDGLVFVLKKSLRPHKSHPHSYSWHDGHTNHHVKHLGPGILVDPQWVQHRLAKKDEAAHANEQFAPAQTSSTYAKHAAPYGNVTPGSPNEVTIYPYHGHGNSVNKLVASHGYTPYYAGGRHGRPDLANKNYNTKHLMIYDPESGSGGDFGHTEYTDNWRKVHELAHALTYPELNQTYGEGRRIGGLGKQRSTREALRAVHWEWLAAHKQRELSAGMGIHISDPEFHKELNTVMHDAVHRAVTGKFTDPAGEGFRPFDHKVPLETALSTVRESAHNLGLQGPHDLIKKSEGSTTVAEKAIDLNELRHGLADVLKKKIDEYANDLRALRERELAKKSPPGKYKELPEKLKDQGHSADSAFAIAWSQHDKDKGEKSVKKNAQMGYGAEGPASMGMSETAKAEMCKSCGKSHAMGKCDMDDVKPGKNVAKGEMRLPRVVRNAMRKEEIKDKGKGAVLPGDKDSKVVQAKGSGGQIKKGKKLAKALPGMKPKAASPEGMPLAGGAIPPVIPGKKQIKLPGMTAKPGDIGGQLADMNAAHGAKGMGSQPLHSKQFAGPAQQMALTPPPAAVKGPPAAAPAAAPAAGAGQNPFGNNKKAAAAPASAKPAMKNETEGKTLAKAELGNCLMCKKPEHNGNCQ